MGASMAAGKGLDSEVEKMKQGYRHHYVSFHDVKKHHEYIAWVREQEELPAEMFNGLSTDRFVFEVNLKPPVELLLKILHENGLDVHEKIIETNCSHRTYDGSVHNTVRYSGSMRSDEQWCEFLYKKIGVRI